MHMYVKHIYSRQVQSLFQFGSRHEEGIEHGHSLREHGDLQLMIILTKGKKKGRTNILFSHLCI